MDKIKVLYIAGPERGGSTILGNILGELDSVFFAGELLGLWEYAFLDRGECSCGVPMLACELWKSILEEAFGDLGDIDFNGLDRLNRYHVYSPAFLEVLIFQLQGKNLRLGNPLKPYLKSLDRLYRSIQANTGCSVIVDSSKRPLYATLLEILPSVDLYVLHLVRDARAVAYSWLRNKVKLGVAKVEGKQVYMDRYNPLTSVLRWNNRNISFEILSRYLKERYLFLRYEDFVKEPRKATQDILSFMNEQPLGMPFLSDCDIYLHTGHSVRGNPSRFNVGRVTLRPDLEWCEKMRPVDRMITTMLSWPLLSRYGYPLKGRQ